MPTESIPPAPGRVSRLAALAAAIALAAALALPACAKDEPAPSPEELKPIIPAPGEVAPESLRTRETRPPHIKLRRNKDGTYSYELSGQDVDGILETEKRLREAVDEAGSGGNS